MANRKDKKLNHGAQCFDLYYQSIYQERWQSLKQSLLQESNPVPFKFPQNQTSEDEKDKYIEHNNNGNYDKNEKSCKETKTELRTYYLDAASVLVAYSLPLKDATEILDLCAAPGGKTLVLSSLMEKNAHLTSNERSFERKQRLCKVVQEHIPLQVQNRITITCSDGALLCKTKQECFDRILLDAPCSSERHLLQNEKYLLQWSPARIKTLSIQQWALLSSAYRMLKCEGILVYSTCALTPRENDEVVNRLFSKFQDATNLFFDFPEYEKLKNDFDCIKVCCPQLVFPNYERTKYGYQILPDKQNGAGPIYFSIIKKGISK